MKQISLKKGEQVLVVAPHPDDESIGVGGLLLSYPDQCTVIVMTDGGKADPEVDPRVMKQTRKNEFEEAMELAGVKEYRMLGYPDGQLALHPDALNKIEIEKYSMIFVPHESEGHIDHMSLVSFVKRRIVKKERKCPLVLQYETRRPIQKANYFLDISECINKKIEMIRKYKSQIKIFDHASFAEAINHYQACRSGKSTGHYETYTRLETHQYNNIIENEYLNNVKRIRNQNEILERWINLKIKGNKISYCIKKNGWNSVSIYGFGQMGRLLLEELETDSIDVLYVMDRRYDRFQNEVINIYNTDYYDPCVDVVIVTTLLGYVEIQKDLLKMGYSKVIHLRDVFEMCDKEGLE